ncbi:MAG: metallophosphoesterase family protein [Candidatus Hecatellaceae archaeon]
MKPFSFVHLADIHLGYNQYNLSERGEDFARAFQEAVDKTLKLKPEFVVMAGDIFDSPRPSNKTLATAIRELRRLREANIKVFAVDGSHDLEPSVMIGTILTPLHNAGLLIYLPRVQGGWEAEDYYLYGIRSSRTLVEADTKIPKQLAENPPKPKPDKFNILCFHGALDDPKYSPSRFKPDLRVNHLPEGFQYYAGGHLHQPFKAKFKTGLIVYPGSLETTSYDEAEFPKGFYHVRVESLGEPPQLEHIPIETARKFLVRELEFQGKRPEEIMAEAERTLRSMDVEGAVAVLVLKGKLPEGFKRSQINVHRLRELCGKTLYTMIVNQLAEAEVQREPLKIREAKEVKAIAYQHLLKIFQSKYPGSRGEARAKAAIELLEPLLTEDSERVESILRGVVEADRQEA